MSVSLPAFFLTRPAHARLADWDHLDAGGENDAAHWPPSTASAFWAAMESQALEGWVLDRSDETRANALLHVARHWPALPVVVLRALVGDGNMAWVERVARGAPGWPALEELVLEPLPQTSQPLMVRWIDAGSENGNAYSPALEALHLTPAHLERALALAPDLWSNVATWRDVRVLQGAGLPFEPWSANGHPTLGKVCNHATADLPLPGDPLRPWQNALLAMNDEEQRSGALFALGQVGHEQAIAWALGAWKWPTSKLDSLSAPDRASGLQNAHWTWPGWLAWSALIGLRDGTLELLVQSIDRLGPAGLAAQPAADRLWLEVLALSCSSHAPSGVWSRNRPDHVKALDKRIATAVQALPEDAGVGVWGLKNAVPGLQRGGILRRRHLYEWLVKQAKIHWQAGASEALRKHVWTWLEQDATAEERMRNNLYREITALIIEDAAKAPPAPEDLRLPSVWLSAALTLEHASRNDGAGQPSVNNSRIIPPALMAWFQVPLGALPPAAASLVVQVLERVNPEVLHRSIGSNGPLPAASWPALATELCRRAQAWRLETVLPVASERPRLRL